jgi:hypothetical protein
VKKMRPELLLPLPQQPRLARQKQSVKMASHWLVLPKPLLSRNAKPTLRNKLQLLEVNIPAGISRRFYFDA